jgi:hypothetical protein
MGVRDPVALARVHWRENDGPPPAPGSCLASTAVFVLGGDEEVFADWPAGGEHFSVMLELMRDVTSADDAQAKVDFLARSQVAPYLHDGARFLFMAGRRVLAEAEITTVLWRPEE